MNSFSLLLTFPLEISLGSFSISLHFIFEALAFFIGFRYFLYLRKNSVDVISTSNRLWILVGAIFGALIFSRLVGGLENPSEFFKPNQSWMYYYGNKTILGALFGGLICVEGMKKVIGEKNSSGDLFTFPIILGMMIGRIGCLTAGVYEETYGIESTLPWAMDLGDGLKRHPVSLYEIIFLGLLWIFLISVEKVKKFKSGLRFQIFLIAYFLFRFLLDFIKPGFRFSIGLGTIQFVCLLGLLYYWRTILGFFYSPLRH